MKRAGKGDKAREGKAEVEMEGEEEDRCSGMETTRDREKGRRASEELGRHSETRRQPGREGAGVPGHAKEQRCHLLRSILPPGTPFHRPGHSVLRGSLIVLSCLSIPRPSGRGLPPALAVSLQSRLSLSPQVGTAHQMAFPADSSCISH